MSKTITTPEVGRHVHYVPAADNEGERCVYRGRPHAAVIAFVHGPTLVNLTVFDCNGVPFGKTSVRLQQPGEAEPTGQSYARWMPYHIERKAELEASSPPAA